MQDFIIYAQFLMLITNIFVLVFIMEQKEKLKAVKIFLLIAISLGTIANFGKLTWAVVFFALTPFLLIGQVLKGNNTKDKNVA